MPRVRSRRLLDDSPHRHATAHFHATQHPIIEGYDPPEAGAGVMSTIRKSICRIGRRNGPIPRYV